jgi:hypothetical protein
MKPTSKSKGNGLTSYRAVDSTGQTIDFMLSAKRDAGAAKRFFRKMLKLPQHSSLTPELKGRSVFLCPNLFFATQPIRRVNSLSLSACGLDLHISSTQLI